MLYIEMFGYIFRFMRLERTKVFNPGSYNFMTWLVMFAVLFVCQVVLGGFMEFSITNTFISIVKSCAQSAVNQNAPNTCSFFTDAGTGIVAAYSVDSMMNAAMYMFFVVAGCLAVFYLLLLFAGKSDRFWAFATLATGLYAIAGLIVDAAIQLFTYPAPWFGNDFVFAFSTLMNLAILPFTILFVFWFQRLVYATLDIRGLKSYFIVIASLLLLAAGNEWSSYMLDQFFVSKIFIKDWL